MTKAVSNISEFIFDKPLTILLSARGARRRELNFLRFATCFRMEAEWGQTECFSQRDSELNCSNEGTLKTVLHAWWDGPAVQRAQWDSAERMHGV